MSLPVTFGLLLAVAALLGVYATWQSLRAAFHAGPLRDLPSLDVSEARRALEDEKAALLGNIRDLAFEHDAGKVSEEDFKREDAALRKRAREVLRLLDEDLDSYRRRADELITEALGGRGLAEPADSAPADVDKGTAVACHACGKDNDSDAEFCKKCGANLSDRECGECGTKNDADAAFCKKCGASVSGEADEEEAASEADKEEAEPEGASAQNAESADSQHDEGPESSEDAGEVDASETGEATEGEAESSDEEEPS